MTRDRPEIVAVGLTGGIGAGKSTALYCFTGLGAITVSADAIVHDLYARPDIAGRIAARFGPRVLDTAGDVDRSRLAQAVQGRLRELRWLEKLTHPLVAGAIRDLVRGAPAGSVVVCEVPLLFEAGFEEFFDFIVTIEAGPGTRRERSVHAFGPEQFSEFERLQAASERRIAGSHLVYFNDGTLDALCEFVRTAYHSAVTLLGEGNWLHRQE